MDDEEEHELLLAVASGDLSNHSSTLEYKKNTSEKAAVATVPSFYDGRKPEIPVTHHHPSSSSMSFSVSGSSVVDEEKQNHAAFSGVQTAGSFSGCPQATAAAAPPEAAAAAAPPPVATAAAATAAAATPTEVFAAVEARQTFIKKEQELEENEKEGDTVHLEQREVEEEKELRLPSALISAAAEERSETVSPPLVPAAAAKEREAALSAAVPAAAGGHPCGVATTSSSTVAALRDRPLEWAMYAESAYEYQLDPALLGKWESRHAATTSGGRAASSINGSPSSMCEPRQQQQQQHQRYNRYISGGGNPSTTATTTIEEKYWKHRAEVYAREGLRRSVAAVLLCHRQEYPHLLLLYYRPSNKYRLFCFKYRSWEKPAIVLQQKLQKYVIPPHAAATAAETHKWISPALLMQQQQQQLQQQGGTIKNSTNSTSTNTNSTNSNSTNSTLHSRRATTATTHAGATTEIGGGGGGEVAAAAASPGCGGATAAGTATTTAGAATVGAAAGIGGAATGAGTAAGTATKHLVVGEFLGELWRSEFNDEPLPYIPPHVSRPKERIRLYQVLLPSSCSFHLGPGYALTALPLFDIYSRSYGVGLSGIPMLLCRFRMRLMRPCSLKEQQQLRREQQQEHLTKEETLTLLVQKQEESERLPATENEWHGGYGAASITTPATEMKEEQHKGKLLQQLAASLNAGNEDEVKNDALPPELAALAAAEREEDLS